MVWRRRAILWWVFAASFVLGGLGTFEAARTLNSALGHSLAREQLVKGFDLGMFYELVRLPEVNLLHARFESYACAVLFALLMLFISGGVLAAYRDDRPFSPRDFFAACGTFLWCFVRLAVCSVVLFSILRFAIRDVRSWSEYLGDKATADQVEFAILLFGLIVLAFLALMVRIWFDLAKIRAVAQNDVSALRNLWAAFELTSRHAGALLWMYTRICIVAAVISLLGFVMWIKLPPSAIPATFVLLELVVFVQLTARLWQLASATEWYKLRGEMLMASETALDVKSQPELLTDADLELPPADG